MTPCTKAETVTQAPKAQTLGNMLVLDLNEFHAKGFAVSGVEIDNVDKVIRVRFTPPAAATEVK